VSYINESNGNPKEFRQEVPLDQSWNLISLCSDISVSDLSNIAQNITSIKDCSYSWRKDYASPSKSHLNTLTELKIGSGYFVEASSNAGFYISGHRVDLIHYKLFPGWNLVSYPFQDSRNYDEWLNFHKYNTSVDYHYLIRESGIITFDSPPVDLNMSKGYFAKFINGHGLPYLDIHMSNKEPYVSVRLAQQTLGNKWVEIRPNDCSNIHAYQMTFHPSSMSVAPDLDLSGGNNLTDGKYKSDLSGLPIYYNNSKGKVLAIPYDESGNKSDVTYDASASNPEYVRLFNIYNKFDLYPENASFIDINGLEVSANIVSTLS